MKVLLPKILGLVAGLIAWAGVCGQQNIFWRDNAANGNWENGSCAEIGTPASQWWYPTFGANAARNRPDCNDGSSTRHNLNIDNNHELTMTLNTTFWGIRSLTLTNTATSNRTINSSPDDGSRGISLTDGLYNNSNSGVTHTFNARIGIDAGTVTLSTATAGAITTYNREIFGNANTTLFDGNGATNVASVISGVGAIVTKNGSGTLTLSGASANTYTGATTVNGGLLVLNKSANIVAIPASLSVATGVTVRTDASNQWGTSTPPLVTLNGAAILNLNDNNQKIALASASSTASVTLGSATLNIDNIGNDIYAGTITGTGALLKTNTGIHVLSGTGNSYSGSTTITGGTLRLGAAGVIPDASNVVLNGGIFSTGAAAGFSETAGTLSVTANSTIALGTGSHNLTFANSSATTFTPGTILTITGWTGTNNGNSSGTAGRIFIGNTAGGLTGLQLSRIRFNISSVLCGAMQLSTGEIVPTGGPVLYYGGATGTWTGSLWGANELGSHTSPWVSGSHAVMNIASANTLTFATTNVAGITYNANITFASGGTFGTGPLGGAVMPLFVENGRTFSMLGQTISGAAGAGMIKSGPGVLHINTGGTYSGGFVMNEGLFVAGGVNAMGGGATNTLTVNGGTIGASGTLDFIGKYTNGITINGDFTLGSSTSPSAAASNLTFANNTALGSSVTRTITLGGTGTYTWNGIISGTNSNLTLAATVAGTLSLGGANTYGGSTTINGGTLQLTTGADRLPTTTGLNFGNISGAVLNLNGQNQTVVSLSGGGTSGGNVSLGAGVLTVNGTPSTTYSGIISGTGALVKSGSGILTLENSANSFTGTTTINTTSELRLNPVFNATYASQIKLNSGKLSTTGIATNRTWTSSSTLSLDATSTIDLGSNVHTISFANSNGVTWNGSATLTINGWTGTATNPGTAGRIFLGNNSTSLTASQLAQITFSGYPGIPILLSTGELVPGIGVTFTWNGSVSNDWGTAANWTPGSSTPGSNDLVVIPGTIDYNIALNITGNRTCNSFTISSNGAFSISPGSILTVTGNFVYSSTSSSTFDCASTLNLSSTFSQNIPALNFGNLNLTGGPRVLASSGTISICGTYTPSASTTTITGSTVNFNGTGVQVVPAAHNYNALVIANSNVAAVTMGANFSVANGLTVNNGSNLAIGSGLILTLSGGASQVDGRLRNSGTLTQSGGTLAFGNNSLYEHNINGGNLPAATWDNNSPGATCSVIGWLGATGAPGGLTPSGGFSNFIWNSPGQTGTPNFDGNLQLVNRMLTITSTGAANRINLSNTGTPVLTVGEILINGGILATNNGSAFQTINCNGNFTVTSGSFEMNATGAATAYTNVRGDFVHTGGTIARIAGNQYFHFDGSSGAQNLTITNPLNVTGAVNFRLNNSNGLQVTTGSTFPINGGAVLQVSQGNVTLNGTAAMSYGTSGGLANLLYDPTGSIAISTKDEWPLTGMRSVRINSVSSQPIILNNTREMSNLDGTFIQFDAGRLALGNNNLIILNNLASAVVANGGYAETNGSGQLLRSILTSPGPHLYYFPVGNSGNYTPALYNFTSNSVAGRQLGVRSVGAVHPNMAPNPADYLNNRYWVTTLSDASGTYSYTPGFTYISGDIMGTIGNVRLSRWNSITWSNTNSSGAAGVTLSSTVALTQTTGNLANGQWSGRAVKPLIDYTWTCGCSGSWDAAANWTPNGIPTTGDIVRFIHPASFTVSNVPTSIALNRMLVSGTGTTTLTTTSGGSLSIGGGVAPVFDVASGSTIIVSGLQTINTVILSGSTGTVAGNVQLRAESSPVSHTLEAQDASGLTFTGGSYFTAGSTANTNYSGNPFGNGTSGTVVFTNGSVFEQVDGGNPFGTNNVVSFQTGSLYRYSDNNSNPIVVPSFSGRSYANFEYNSTQTKSVIGTSAFTMDNLTIAQGTFNINMTTTPGHSIRGHITVANGATLNFNPSEVGTVVLGGTGGQNISGGGIFSTNGNSTLSVTNNVGINLLKNITVDGILAVSATGVFNMEGENVVSGAGSMATVAGSTLGIGSVDGITTNPSIAGNVRTTTRTYNAGANYVYKGTANQNTGNGLPGTITGRLEIANTGVANHTVTLTTVPTTTANLTLSNGRFAAGASTNQLNISSGGSVNGVGGDFVAGAIAGILNFVGSGTFSGNCNPYNVHISGGVNFGAGAVTIQNGGRLRINAGGFADINGPFYAAGSTLEYNTAASFTAGTEWYALFTSGRGVPHHVQIGRNGVNNSQLAFGTSTNWRYATGDITIGDGSGGSGYGFALATNPGGDVRLEGNWTRHLNGAFTTNNRAVFFTGNAGNQTITRIGGGTETFAYFIVNKPNGNMQLTGAPNSTNVVVNGTGGNNLQLLQGNIDLNGRQFEWAGTGNLQTAGNREIFSVNPATFLVSGGTRAIAPGAGSTLVFNNQTTVIISAGLDFAANTTTINATLQINAGGFANINAPVYGPNGVLIYNTGTNYLRRVEWNGVDGGPGFPNDVIVRNNSILVGGGDAGNSVASTFGARRNVTIEPGSRITMANEFGSGNMTVPLTVGRDLLIEGNITASNAFGGDIEVGQNWTRTATGTFTPNNRAVFFNTSHQGAIVYHSGTEFFPFVIVDKAGSADYSLTLNSPVDIGTKFTLSSGRVITNATNLLTITNTAIDDANNGVAVANLDNNPGYVHGPMRRYVQNTTGNDRYLFPVGKFDGTNHFYKRFMMRDLGNSAPGNYFTGEYVREQPPGSDWIFGANLTAISANEYWDVNRVTGSTAQARLILPYVNPGLAGWRLSTIVDFITPDGNSNVAIVRGDLGSPNEFEWDFTAPDSTSFANEGPLIQARQFSINGDINSRLVTAFSPFTFGFANNSILPLRLLTFTASPHGPDALLHWQLADAKDLKLFEVEYSTDGQRFSRLITINNNGGTAYHYRHAKLPQGVHYYRLQMVEKDGRRSHSKTEVLMVNTNRTLITGLLQNPVQGGNAIVRSYSATYQMAEVMLMDITGRMLMKQKLRLQTGFNQSSVSIMLLPSSMYKLIMRTEDGVEKVMTLKK